MRNKLEQAIEFALEAHEGQTDRAAVPYILHPLYVMKCVENESEDTQIIAVLHDTIEDTSVTRDEIRERFGADISDVVYLLSHKQGESYEEYITRIINAHSRFVLKREALLVKKYDLKHNMELTRLSKITENDYARKNKYQRALDRVEKILDNAD